MKKPSITPNNQKVKYGYFTFGAFEDEVSVVLVSRGNSEIINHLKTLYADEHIYSQIASNLQEDDLGACVITKQSVLVLFNGTPTNNTIAHEAFHLTAGLLRKAGVELTEDTEEVYAHYLGFTVSKIGEIIKKLTK